MKLILYALGAMAQVGLCVIIAAALWFFTDIDALEVVSIACAAGTAVMILIFIKVEEILEDGRFKDGHEQHGDNLRGNQHSD